MRITDIADDVAELATRLSNALPERLHAMRDEMAGQPAAARYDSDGASHQWCWNHERDVEACHAEDLGCTGETIVVHDPAGEAAVSGDPARRDRKQLERHLRAAQTALDAATTILSYYAPARPIDDRSGIGTCNDCRRYFDGTRGARVSAYKGGDPVCAGCRARRDRREPANAQVIRAS